MAGLLSAYIEHFTYLGLLAALILCGLGLPIPEDAALLTGGFLVHQGRIHYTPTLVVSLVGVVVGDNLLFLVGQRFGRGFLRYLGLDRPAAYRQIERLERFMRRHGSRAVLYARFLAGLRALIYLSAGSLGVSPRNFFFYDLMGAVVSVPVVVSLGYLFGGEIEKVIHYLGNFERVALMVAALALIVHATRMLRSRGGGRAAPVKELRRAVEP